MTMSLMKRPSAWVPIAMSLSALALVLAHVAIFGPAREADEGTPAHLFHLLMAGQVPVGAYFAVKWLPRAPRQALAVLGLQAAAGVAAVAPVYWFNL
jgi:hypothetical protein